MTKIHNNMKEEKNNKNFEDIKHIEKKGTEYWYARELQLVLDYKEWRKIDGVIKKSIKACENSGISSLDHFVGADKTIQMPKGATKKVKELFSGVPLIPNKSLYI